MKSQTHPDLILNSMPRVALAGLTPRGVSDTLRDFAPASVRDEDLNRIRRAKFFAALPDRLQMDDDEAPCPASHYRAEDGQQRSPTTMQDVVLISALTILFLMACVVMVWP